MEIGTFRGYSALAVALALPPAGQVITCDVNEEWPASARPFWHKAGVGDRIQFRLGPAIDTLNSLLADGQEEMFDFAFIDADKINHDAYYECVLRLVRPGGIIIFDNVFWDAYVIDPSQTDPDTEAVRALNRKVHEDSRITISTIPLSDGLTIALRH